MENKKCKVGDIICRTTIPDRIVINKANKLYTIKLNNGRIEPLMLDEFDVAIGNVYDKANEKKI
jgi:hypothetical protein